MASAHLSETVLQLINDECRKATVVQISRKIARCRSNTTTIKKKVDGSKRTLAQHPANDIAASDLAQYLIEINAQYWRVSHLMEIYIAMLEEDTRVNGTEVDVTTYENRDEGMRNEYKKACLEASEAIAHHQNMLDIRNGLSISDDQRPRAIQMQAQAAAPNNAGRQNKANREFQADTLTKDASASQYEFWKRKFRRYYNTSNMDLAPIEDQRGHLEKCIDAHLGTALTTSMKTPGFGQPDPDAR